MRLRVPCLVVLAGLFAQAAMAAETVPLPQPRPDAGTPNAGTPDTATPNARTPDAATPDAGAPDASRFGGGPHIDKPIQNSLPQPATMTPPSADAVNPDRFGAKPADAAYGAFQRGLYKTAYNLAMERATSVSAAGSPFLARSMARL